MNTAGYVSLALTLLNAVLPNIKGSEVASEAVGYIEAAVQNLLKVHGSDVTMAQLESLRVKHTF